MQTFFGNFFMKRGYKRPALLKTATEISKIDKRTLIEYKHREESRCIPLVLTWYHQIQSISKVIHSSYSVVANKFPEFRTVYRCPNSISSYFVKNRYTPKENSTPPSSKHFQSNSFPMFCWC